MILMHASGVLDFLLDRTALWVGGLRKVGINLQLRHIGLHRVELHRITRAGIYKKNQIKGILKVSYCFITSWQRHSNDFRLQSVVDLRWYEYDFCLFYTQTYVVFLLFKCRLTLSMGFGHRNCVVLGCPNSGQRLGKWAATTCELHGCNNGSSMCDCQPPFKLFPFPTEKKNPERRLQWAKNISRNSLNGLFGCLTRIQEFVIYTSLTVNQRLKTQTQLCNLVTARKREPPNAHHQRHGITLLQ